MAVFEIRTAATASASSATCSRSKRDGLHLPLPDPRPRLATTSRATSGAPRTSAKAWRDWMVDGNAPPRPPGVRHRGARAQRRVRPEVQAHRHADAGLRRRHARAGRDPAPSRSRSSWSPQPSAEPGRAQAACRVPACDNAVAACPCPTASRCRRARAPVRVTLTLTQPAASSALSLPVWIPGSYLVREFARHLSAAARRAGRARRARCSSSTRRRWQVALQRQRARCVVSYQVYAFDNSVRTAWLDARARLLQRHQPVPARRRPRGRCRTASSWRALPRGLGRGHRDAALPVDARLRQLRGRRLRRAGRPPGRDGPLLERRVRGRRRAARVRRRRRAARASTASGCWPTRRRICETQIALLARHAAQARRSSATCSCSTRWTTATAASSTAPAPR